MSSTTATTTKTDLLDGRFVKTLGGLELHLKSPAIEEAMKLISVGRNLSTNPTNGLAWEGLKFYQPEMGANGIPVAFPGFAAGRFDQWGSRELVFARAPMINLSMLLAVGLGNGIVVKIPTVISTKQQDAFLEGFKAAIIQFYIDFLKEGERTIRITVEDTILP